MSVKMSNPSGVTVPGGQYSQAARVSFNSDLLFISGQGPQNIDGETVGIGDMTAQAEQVFQNLQAILEAHNSSFAKVTRRPSISRICPFWEDLMLFVQNIMAKQRQRVRLLRLLLLLAPIGCWK
ncbi:MAG: RidA family protein [Anaerolineae bacterium]|jgi:hypothetical protein|nr:RidA family protein [Anaerolineae bacterium]MBT7189249.1 RidA family protein [Anaerolineae bacterium]MBT7991340.1 RidA family protein [Anaerolineae bacterium]